MSAFRIDFTHPSLPTERLCFEAPLQHLVAHSEADVPGVIEAAEQASLEGYWVAGYLAYEAAPAFDSTLPTASARRHWPLAEFLVFDAADARLPECELAQPSVSTTPWCSGVNAGVLAEKIETIRAGIADGDFYQVNLTAPWQALFEGDVTDLYANLRTAQPQSFGMLLDFGHRALVSVSPELFFHRDSDGDLRVRPMKGTAPRHSDPASDLAAREALRLSEKERAENLMIVDLLRNDLSRVARAGSVEVPELFAIEPLPTAWQMTSTVTAKPRAGTGLVDVLRALFPCGSITGAPKRAAMQAICELESGPRGVYCGALGLLRPDGSATFSVGIRTVTLEGQKAVCGIGSGITFDSSAEGEIAEWEVKRRFLWRGTAPFELLETLRLENSRFPALAGHLSRLTGSARHFGFPCDTGRVHALLDSLSTVHPNGSWRVRLLLDRQGDVRVEVFPLDASPTTAHVTLAAAAMPDFRELAPDLLAHKTTERAHYPAPPAGCFDVLLYTQDGFVTEFSRGNLVYALGGQRYTPPADGRLLPGVGRAALLQSGAVVERALRIDELPACSSLCFVNALRGEIPAILAPSE